jgi:hypothetical protein
MGAEPSDNTCSSGEPLRSFFAAWLSDDEVVRWRAFAERVPWATYEQDPAWARIAEGGGQSRLRRASFFWSERGGEICLTALGVRRRLPLTKRAFWEFEKGPVFLDAAVLDEWLTWLTGTLRRDVARLRIEPGMPLAAGGDDVETLLEWHGFVRRRSELRPAAKSRSRVCLESRSALRTRLWDGTY